MYSYRVKRLTQSLPLEPTPAPPQESAEEELSYRELQAQAKELEIPANQSREDLEAAIAEANSDE